MSDDFYEYYHILYETLCNHPTFEQYNIESYVSDDTYGTHGYYYDLINETDDHGYNISLEFLKSDNTSSPDSIYLIVKLRHYDFNTHLNIRGVFMNNISKPYNMEEIVSFIENSYMEFLSRLKTNKKD